MAYILDRFCSALPKARIRDTPYTTPYTLHPTRVLILGVFSSFDDNPWIVPLSKPETS